MNQRRFTNQLFWSIVGTMAAVLFASIVIAIMSAIFAPKAHAMDEELKGMYQKWERGHGRDTKPSKPPQTPPPVVTQTVTQNPTQNPTINQQVNANTSVTSPLATGSISGGNVTIDYPKQVAAVIPPALSSGYDTCMGSSSGGVGTTAVGLSFGTTWTDKHCQMLRAAKLLSDMGLRDAAIRRMCADEEMRKALGGSC